MVGRLRRPNPSLSNSALLLSPCIAWAHPDAKQYDDRFTDTTKRDRGTFFHSLIHGYISGGERSHLLAKCSDDEMRSWLMHAMTYVEQVLAPRCASIQSEVAIAINWITGEVHILPDVKDRKYPEQYQSGGWQCGTADLVCILKDGTLLIADWKTGGTDGATEQLLSLAYAFREAMPTMHLLAGNGTKLLEDSGSGVVEYSGRPPQALFAERNVKISCLKVFDTGVVPDERNADGMELSLHRDAMLFKVEEIGKEYKPITGIHCTTMYCPHLAHCRAVTGIVEDASEGAKALLAPEALVRKYRMTDKPTSPDEAGYVMARVTAAKRQLDYYANAMKEYANNGGTVTCGGYVWSKGKDGFRWRKS